VRGERGLLRVGEYLVGRASRRLPARDRDERCREWAAELPVILRDPEVRSGLRRAARMLGYALDTIRGTAPGRGTSRPGWVHRRASRLQAAALRAAIVGVAGFLFYESGFGTGLEARAAAWVQGLACLISLVVMRRRARDLPGTTTIMVVGLVLYETWQLALIVAQRAGSPLRPPLLTGSVSWAFTGMFLVGTGITVARMIRARRTRLARER
jgi:hypothetical protein